MAPPDATLSEIFVSLQGEGPHAGRRHLFVRFAGCPLRCRWCDTPGSLEPVARCLVHGPDGPEPITNPIGAAALDAIVERLVRAAPPLHALAVTGGEPLAQAAFLEMWLGGRPAGLPVLLETAGIRPDRLRRVLPFVHIASLDLKCPSNTGERPRWDEHEACVAAAVEAGVETYVKMPIDAGTADADVERGMRIAAAHGVSAFLTPITVPGRTRDPDDAAALDRLHALASRIHPDVRLLPQIHPVLGVP